MTENGPESGDKSQGNPQNSSVTSPTPGPPATVVSPPRPQPQTSRPDPTLVLYNSVENLFKNGGDEVSGEGPPTPLHRVHAFTHGYRLSKTEAGWVAKKRS